jgi:hypothetical protein
VREERKLQKKGEGVTEGRMRNRRMRMCVWRRRETEEDKYE